MASRKNQTTPNEPLAKKINAKFQIMDDSDVSDKVFDIYTETVDVHPACYFRPGSEEHERLICSILQANQFYQSLPQEMKDFINKEMNIPFIEFMCYDDQNKQIIIDLFMEFMARMYLAYNWRNTGCQLLTADLIVKKEANTKYKEWRKANLEKQNQ